MLIKTKELQEQIRGSSKEAVIDRVAYTWFNRFCALRYMDVNHYTPLGIVSPVAGFTQPEILQEAKQGVIDDSIKVDKPAPAPVREPEPMAEADSESPTERYHIVSAGDTLGHIAQKYYGNAGEYTKIFEANRDILDDPNLIKVGQKLKIPVLD